MKLYEFQFSVRQGDLTFNFTDLLEAEDDKDADRKAHIWCCDFYGDKGEKTDDNVYEFQCGCIALTINSIKEVDKEAWKEEQYKFAFRNIE